MSDKQYWYDYASEHLGSDISLDILPLDCSTKQFVRITCGDKNMILMDTTDDSETYNNFVKINQLLTQHKLGVPKIYFHDPIKKLAIMEDFGNDSFTKYLEKNPYEEKKLYMLAMRALHDMQKINHHSHNLSSYHAKLMHGIMVFKEWFLEKWCKLSAIKIEICSKLFETLDKTPVGLIMRDYHADNLYYLAQKNAIQQIGIIDFQDAAIGSLAYDVVSLLEDARRDVNLHIVKQAYDFYLDAHNIEDRTQIALAYQILGVQRNLRIIGVFIRKMLRDKQIRYKHYIPRVYNHLKNNPIMHEKELYPLLKIISDQLEQIRNYGEN